MAIKDFYPAIRPALDLNFTGSRSVDPGITFSRSGTGNVASYFDEKGVMRFAPSNVPRIDFNPVTGECLGLLMEEQRTNLLTYSEQFDNAAWDKMNSTVTANSTVAPDGSSTADMLVENTNTSWHETGNGATLVAGTTYALSIYAKASSRTRVRLAGRFSASWTSLPIGVFDLLTGTVVTSTGASSAVISDAGNGWYRCTIFGTTSATVAGLVVSLVQSGTTSSYTGDGTSGLYIWGAQLEQGSFPTSYTPTTSVQVTRAADAASMTGTNFSKWYKQEEGTLLVDYRRNSNKASGNQIPFVVSDGTGNNIIAIADSANGSSDRVLVIVGGVNQASLRSVDYTENQRMVRSIGYKKDDVSASINGSSAASDDLVLIPSVNRLDIGYASYFSASRINGYISRLSYYPKRLSNTNLQALAA